MNRPKPFRGDVKEVKVPTCAHPTKLKGSSAIISTEPFLTPRGDVSPHRRVTDWQGMRTATNPNKLWGPGSSLPPRLASPLTVLQQTASPMHGAITKK